MASSGAGYAKAILFGEHFVVYGLPAIGAGLSKKVTVEITKSGHTLVESAHVDSNLLNGLEAVKKAMGISDNFIIKIKSEIPVASGLGSSAAVAVAFVRALSEEYKFNLPDEQVSTYAYSAEKVYHGNPSGIDNSLATYGGALLYQKKALGDPFRKLAIGRPLNLVIGSTGKKRKPTSEIIAEVKARRERNPVLFKHMFDAELQLIEFAAKAIEQGRLEAIGELMNINHGFLSAMGVSVRENEEIVQCARDAGALGSKITGAGCGGSCVALARNEKGAEEIAAAIRKLGYVALTANVQ